LFLIAEIRVRPRRHNDTMEETDQQGLLRGSVGARRPALIRFAGTDAERWSANHLFPREKGALA